ncbi:MAG TPA: hypothetical protein VEB21_21340 [Terriglobales bacterium]|nr:hypothetical protein [Terriglobales bacterium]
MIATMLSATSASAGPSGIVYRTETHESGKKIVYVPREDIIQRRVVLVEPPEPEPSAAAMAADVLISRPLSLVTTVIGSVLFVGSMPFSAAAGDVETPAARLVGDPARYTFRRPLGELERSW